ncbi:related to COQ1 - hexaprenyl pyrophosphate synthetase precursor [Melanopsichium pennsylvanicum]|uniref:(2E,6E)-farnesyl diphosphate synthase n=2 Tax=Melanopsichium pennsylvanicum TaxID=63383 RepID=A0AAJ4XIT4_9BASI|nr:related to COQ1-hexaprenyl pyrophosphate synthetase precursor [Melanopsichium pennsylvanicum 4]SNX83409.1 related to COQ1 - hexaprenyl pyrophosphate synthetase precursor [Melanopsichium pennsylvanicum]
MPPRLPRIALARARSLTTSMLNVATPRVQSSWASAIHQAKNLVQDQLAQFPTFSTSNTPSKSHTPSAAAFFGASYAASPTSAHAATPIIQDPLSLVSSELSSLRNNVSSLLGSGHPSLDTIAKYYFQAEGKHVRPLIVLLMSKAVNGLSPLYPQLLTHAQNSTAPNETGKSIERDMGINEPLSPGSVLNDFNPHMESIEGSLSSSSSCSSDNSAQNALASVTGAILPTQRRLAEITEMIHVASLLHDDVIDASPLRRGAPSAPSAFGNKLSILGGDFLLGRASVALARLRDAEVVELLATVIANLVEGEVMQLKSQAAETSASSSSSDNNTTHAGIWESEGLVAHNMGLSASEAQRATDAAAKAANQPTPAHFSLYLQKTYLKTAALIAKSTRASVILAGCGADAIAKAGITGSVAQEMRVIRDAAYGYGRNLGIAFQLVDDLLDFQSTSAAFGKPSGGADLRLGLATAPVLYAWQELPGEGIHELVARRFEGQGDVEKMLRLVEKSQGLQRTAELAKQHVKRANQFLDVLPDTDAKKALIKLNEQVIKRVK